jgi:hypothetical protein
LPLAALPIDRFADYCFADLPLSNFAALGLTLPLTLPLSSASICLCRLAQLLRLTVCEVIGSKQCNAD